MADYYTHFSIGINCTPEQADYFQRMAAYMEQVVDENDGVPPAADPDIADAVKPLWDKHSEDMNGTGCDSSYDDGLLWIRDDCGQPNLDLVGDLLQAYLKKFDIDTAVTLEFACTCSKPRIDAFGGGAAVITKDAQHWMHTNTWVQETLAELGGTKSDA